MADITYAGTTTTGNNTFFTRVAGAVKRAFAAVIDAREREAKLRINAFPPMIQPGDPADRTRL